MSKPVDQEEFWNKRIETAVKPHHAVYAANQALWDDINLKHGRILQKRISNNDKVLDAGCGYGRLATIFKPNNYVGVDFCKRFIDRAKEENPNYEFIQSRLEKLPFKDYKFHYAFCVSIRAMIIGNLGKAVWSVMEKELKRVAQKVIILEYSEPYKYEIL